MFQVTLIALQQGQVSGLKRLVSEDIVMCCVVNFVMNANERAMNLDVHLSFWVFATHRVKLQSAHMDGMVWLCLWCSSGWFSSLYWKLNYAVLICSSVRAENGYIVLCMFNEQKSLAFTQQEVR